MIEHNQAESWAATLLATFQPLVDKASKEQLEAAGALKTLQKAQTAREQAEVTARPVFVRFRRAVRATFGRSSREYRDLLDRRGSAVTDDVGDAPPAAPPGGPRPA